MELDCDLNLMEASANLARARAADAEALIPPLEAIVGSLSRVRVALAEGRVPPMDLEMAAVKAAEEQIDRIGEAHGAA